MAFDLQFSAMWLFANMPTDVAPVPGAWNWNEAALIVTEIAVADLDANAVDRSTALDAIVAGDRLHLRNTSTADNWAMFDIVDNTDQGAGHLLTVALVGVGTVPGLPSFRQRVLFDFLTPAIATAGPISGRFDEIVDRVTDNLHALPGEATVTAAVDAAILYVVDYTDRSDVGLPDDDLTVNGLVGFATRIHQDAFTPNGAQVAVADGSFEPIFQPEDLYKHWHHYFDRLTTGWGIA